MEFQPLLLLSILGIGLLAAGQLIPLPLPLLSRLSPGTIAFFSRIDFRFSLPPDAAAEAGLAVLRHPISVAPEKTLLFLALLAASLLLFVGLLRTLSRTANLRLARGIVFTGFALAMVAILQKAILGDDAFGGMRIYGFWEPEFKLTTPFGPYVNKNHFAGWMLMAIPVAIGLAISELQHASARFSHGARSAIVWLSEPEGGRMSMYLTAALLMTVSLLMTGSRSGLACFAIAVVGAAAFSQRRGSKRAVLGVSLLAVVFLAVALVWAGRDAALGRFASDRGSVQLRLDVWKISGQILRQFPIFGTGLNTFGTATVVYHPPGADQHFTEAHNDYVQLVVEGGVFAFTLVLLAMIGVGRGIAARFRDKVDGPDAYWLRVGATTGLIAIALQSAVEFSLQMPGNAVLFVVLLAMALYVPARRQAPPDRPR